MDFIVFDLVLAAMGIVMMVATKKVPVRMVGVMIQALGFGLLVEDSLTRWTTLNPLLVLLVFVVVVLAMLMLGMRTLLDKDERKSFWQFSLQRLRGR